MVDYQRYKQQAEDELKAGGDIEKAKVWATLALAEATILAPSDSVEITGSIDVDIT